ncbi:hypothetical protein JCM3765_001029 [Sporobolomyces pararoseus]
MEEEVVNLPSPSLLASNSPRDRQLGSSILSSRPSLSEYSIESPLHVSSPASPSRLLAGIRGTRLTPIQQAALLQSIATQRQARGLNDASPAPLASPPNSPRSSNENPHSAFSSLPPLPSASSTSLDEDSMPFSRIQGLNELQTPAPSSSSFADQLAPNHLDELLNAQTNLDIWASTVFSTGSPGFHTPPAYPEPSSSFHTSSSSATSTLPAMVSDEAAFDWSTLYPQSHPDGPLIDSPPPHLPHQLPNGLPAFPLPHPPFPSSFSSIPPLHSALPQSQLTQDDGDLSSRAPSPAPSRPSRSRRASKAPSRSASEGGQGSDTPSLASREFMTPEEIEEDKRRRNTEASARFRAKKKQRNVALQQTAAQLREKVAQLEKEKEALTSQNRWLRDIISEKAESSTKNGK